MTVTLPLAQMTVAEKLSLVQDIMEDLDKCAEDFPSPAWHEEVLAEVDRRLASGEEKVSSWEEAKERLLVKFASHES